jgi:SAM-dependent methyltransferase
VLVNSPAAANDPSAGAPEFALTRADRRTEVVVHIIRRHHGGPLRRLLVVGCGTGREAAVLGSLLHARVTGIDLRDDFDASARRVASLEVADAHNLPFPDASFDFVYSYHALEHVAEPMRVLREMARVLRHGGGYFIGTPNRLRAIAYIGGGASPKEKLLWNLADYRARIAGRFRNELGAHAGYSASELCALLASGFGSFPLDSTHEYYLTLYARHARLVSLLHRSGAGSLAFPCVYFIGRFEAGR